MTGARSFAAIGEYARDKGRLVLDTLNIGGVVAHSATIRRVLVDVDPVGLQEAITAWSLAQLTARDRPPSDVSTRERRPVIAVDGKTVRGARTRTDDDDGSQPHLVAALDQHTGAVLVQTAVKQKASEIAALPVVLDGLDTTDAVITADALHVQRCHADYLHQRGAHYLLPVKANQPTLLRRLRVLPWTAIGVDARERSCGHGRVETRTIAVVSLDPLPDFGPGEFFRHAAQAVRIVRRRRSLRGRWKTTTTYMITSLTPFQAGPALLARWARHHWASKPCTGSATTPSTRTAPRSAPATHPKSWPPCATSPSPHCAWPGSPPSPQPCGTTPATRASLWPPTRSSEDFA